MSEIVHALQRAWVHCAQDGSLPSAIAAGCIFFVITFAICFIVGISRGGRK